MQPLQRWLETPARLAVTWLAPALIAVFGAWGHASAQDARPSSYPDHQVRIVVGYPPGGSVDSNARMLGQKLSERWKQPVVIENRGGAGSSIGATTIAQAPPDGYSLLVASPAHAINATLYKNLPFATETAFAPVAKLSVTPLFLVLHPSVKANSVQELIALAKADPGGLNYASSGSGTSVHLAGTLFNLMAGTKMTHIPYHGGSPAVTALLAGDVQVMFSASEALPHVKSGKLKMIAVTTAARVPEFPDLPTVAESGLPGYDVGTWYGLYRQSRSLTSSIWMSMRCCSNRMPRPGSRRWAMWSRTPLRSSLQRLPRPRSRSGGRLFSIPGRRRIRRIKAKKANCGEHCCDLQANQPVAFAIETGAKGLYFVSEFADRLIQVIEQFGRSLGNGCKCGAAVFHVGSLREAQPHIKLERLNSK